MYYPEPQVSFCCKAVGLWFTLRWLVCLL